MKRTDDYLAPQPAEEWFAGSYFAGRFDK